MDNNESPRYGKVADAEFLGRYDRLRKGHTIAVKYDLWYRPEDKVFICKNSKNDFFSCSTERAREGSRWGLLADTPIVVAYNRKCENG